MSIAIYLGIYNYDTFDDRNPMRKYITKEYRSHGDTYEEGIDEYGNLYYEDCCDIVAGFECVDEDGNIYYEDCCETELSVDDYGNLYYKDIEKELNYCDDYSCTHTVIDIVKGCELAKELDMWDPDKCDCEWVLQNLSREGVDIIVEYIITCGKRSTKKNFDIDMLQPFTYEDLFDLRKLKRTKYVPKYSELYKKALSIASNILDELYPEYEGRIEDKLKRRVGEAVIRYYDNKKKNKKDIKL